METSHLSKQQHVFIATVLFFLTFLIYFRSQNAFLSDSMWTVHITSSIINSGNIDLDEYEQIVADNGSYGVVGKKTNGHILPSFPVGNSILTIPIIWIIEHTKHLPEQQSFYQYLQQTSPKDPYLVSIQHFIASLITALIAPILYYIGCKQFNITVAILGIFVFAFGTSAYSTASRVLWQHGPSMLMLTIAMALFIKGKSDPSAIQWAGIPLAFSFIIRPTNSIPIIILTLIVLLRYRKQFPGFILGAMIIAIPFIWSNLNRYNYFLPPYYNPKRVGLSPHFAEALIGNLISPARGLFIFSPVFIFAIYGIFSRIWRRRFTLLDGAFALIIGLHWIVISSFSHWWGGHSYGPRFFTDMLPFITYFLLMGLYELSQPMTQPRFRQIGMGIFAVLASISIAIHYIGANQSAVSGWFRWPINVDTYPSIRLWDWSDLMFLRTIDQWPLSTLPSNISFDLQNFQTDDLLHIPLHNTAEDAYLWEVKLPPSLKIVQIAGIDYAESGVSTAIGATALPPSGYQWLPIAVEMPLNSFTDPSLGAIMVTTKTLLGEERSVQIIPASIVNNSHDWHDSDALSEQVWLPTDIRINDDNADHMLYGLFGFGWYVLESFEQYQWRWAQSPAELYVFSTKSRPVTLELVFNSIYDETHADGMGDAGKFHISSDEKAWVGEVHVGEPNHIPILLNKGWNTLLFELEAGNFSPADIDTNSSDRRILSFSLDSINIVATD